LSALPTPVSNLSSRSLHFGVVPRYDISPLPPISLLFIGSLFLSYKLPPPLVFTVLYSPILIFLMSPGSALGTLLRSSHELILFYRPIFCLFIYLFIYQLYLLPYFPFPSLTLFIYMVSSVSVTYTY
jgi:hypothetical protein